MMEELFLELENFVKALKTISISLVCAFVTLNAKAQQIDLSKDVPFQSSIGVMGVKNQVLPTKVGDKQVIFWTPSDNPASGNFYYYCTDRSDNSTCQLLGIRAYTNQEIDQASKNLYGKIQTEQKWGNGLVISSLALGVGGILAIAVAAALGVASLGLWLIAGGVALTLSVPIGAYGTAHFSARDALTKQAKQVANLNSKVVPTDDFRKFAETVNDFLANIDPNVNVKYGLYSPEALKQEQQRRLH